MRTLTEKLSSQIAVITKYSEARREAILFKPSINMITAARKMLLSLVFRPIIVNVVNTEKSQLSNPATFALTTVSHKYFGTKLLSMSLLNNINSRAVSFSPFRTIRSGVSECRISVFSVILAVVCSFSISLLWRRFVFQLPFSIGGSELFFSFWRQFSIIFFSHTIYYTTTEI